MAKRSEGMIVDREKKGKNEAKWEQNEFCNEKHRSFCGGCRTSRRRHQRGIDGGFIMAAKEPYVERGCLA